MKTKTKALANPEAGNRAALITKRDTLRAEVERLRGELAEEKDLRDKTAQAYAVLARDVERLRAELAAAKEAIQARALREAADEIAVELVHWTDDGYGLAARSEREIMIHRLRSKAERLEKEATDAPR